MTKARRAIQTGRWQPGVCRAATICHRVDRIHGQWSNCARSAALGVSPGHVGRELAVCSHCQPRARTVGPGLRTEDTQRARAPNRSR